MTWHVEVDPKTGSIRIRYDLEWLLAVMTASSNSMVPFTFFSIGKAKGRAFPARSYPRSGGPGFILDMKGTVDKSSSAGGRHHADVSNIFGLCELFAAGTTDLPVPLSDVAILSKRAVCAEVLRTFKGKNFRVSGGTPYQDKRSPGWLIHGYPMLCIIGEASPAFPKDQGQWRAVQCVFGAVLTRLIRAMGIGIEVVSREGFGSVFPTLADLPNGIRLDPGLLPPRGGAEAIVEALRFTDQFITDMRAQKNVHAAIGRLNGYTNEALDAVDRLMSMLHAYALASPKATAGDHAVRVAAHAGHPSECALPPVPATIEYVLNDALAPARGSLKKRRDEPDEELGYGSESDYEDEDEPGKKKLAKGDGDEEVVVGGGLAVKKFSVLSGMAALRMAMFYGMHYSKALFAGKGSLNGSEVAKTQLFNTWAPYFELDHDALYAGLPSKDGVRMLILDGAPNPINIPDTPIEAPRQLGAIVIDTTNNTSREKADYMAFFQDFLVRPAKARSGGGLLFMVDSASKHPTGGDLVHGVMRVCGTRASVNLFIKHFLTPHLGLGKGSAYNLTVLSASETEQRRAMIAHRLVMRNADLFRTGSASATGSVEPFGTGPSGSEPRGLGGGHAAPPQVVDIPLVTQRNMGKVARIVFPEQRLPAPDLLPKKKDVSSGRASAGEKPGEGSGKKLDEVHELASKKKQFEAQGSFGALPQGPPDLQAPGYYYEEDDIYNLQRYLLQDLPNVAVLPGISRAQWLDMDRSSYTTAVHAAITTNTNTIIQPLQRGVNHWALLYITLSAPVLGSRRARLLYIDPLHPDDVPVEDLSLLRLPFPGIEAERCVVQYQDDVGDALMGSQDSCGAWAVKLAVYLARNANALPAVDVNRKAAALVLRQLHNADIAEARDMDWPQAPGDVRLHVTAPPEQPGLRRRASFGGLPAPKEPVSLGAKKGKKTSFEI